jgi:uncharacterized protein YyaL (SSP411 family)/cytochrome c biogenesis protein CcdA
MKVFVGLLGVWVFLLLATVSFAASPTPTAPSSEVVVSFERSESLKHLIAWNDYNSLAFQKATKEKKPIFLLLTAPAWCITCQQYESTRSLYDPTVITLLNTSFVPVYVDADKRSDIARQYNLYGWPTTIILSPSGKQILGFVGNKSARVLLDILQNYVPKDVNVTPSEKSLSYQKTAPYIPTQKDVTTIITLYQETMRSTFDPQYGGFSQTDRKYPNGRALTYLLENYEKTGDKTWLDMVTKTLDNQYTDIRLMNTDFGRPYHLFDPVEGGFHRFGANRDWSDPHYEKMLYDNSGLLQAYSYLLTVQPSNSIAKDVVDKTNNYMLTHWYDKTNGGFYADTEAVENYYNYRIRPAEKPTINTIKYTDWNADAIIAYLALWKQTKMPAYKNIVQKSIDFLAKEMITPEGIRHFVAPSGEKGVRGNLSDNASLLLALVETYKTFPDKKYLDLARNVADQSITTLYDWNSGGFFQRNSPDINNYPNSENIVLNKPAEENAIMAYSLLQLYLATNNPTYLHTGIQTMGTQVKTFQNTKVYQVQDSDGSHLDFDIGYYYIKASELILDKNLLANFEKTKTQFAEVENSQQKKFWLNNLLASSDKKVRDNTGAQTAQSPLLLLILIALVAGLFSLLSPCSLPILPTVVAYSLRSRTNRLWGMTLSFFLGMTIVFVLLGMGATLIGSFLRNSVTVFSEIAGIMVMIFGVLTLLGKEIPGLHIVHKKPTSYAAAFIFGSAFGISWSPCVGPILAAILAIAATTKTIFTGGLLLFCYSLGLALPLLLLAFYFSKRKENSRLYRILRGQELTVRLFRKTYVVHSTTLVSGILFIIIGYLMFSGQLYTLNKFVAATTLQELLFHIDDWLIRISHLSTAS